VTASCLQVSQGTFKMSAPRDNA